MAVAKTAILYLVVLVHLAFLCCLLVEYVVSFGCCFFANFYIQLEHNFGGFRNTVLEVVDGSSIYRVVGVCQGIVCNRQDKLRIINTKVLLFGG